MPHEHGEIALRHLQTLFEVGALTGFTDSELLEQFARRNGEPSEVAFTELVQRHGSMVLRVCRSIVGNNQDAQDAFQATFFILARKGNGLWVRDSLAPWLHRVASCAAGRLKVSRNRQRAIERRAAQLTAGSTEFECPDDWGQAIHAELDRLPRHFRLPVILCDLEGHSYEAASTHLDCPIGTLKSRLARGRERLRRGLLRRGVAPTEGAAILSTMSPETIPSTLLRCTIQSAVWIKPGSDAATGAISASVIALSEGVLKAMSLTRIRTAIAMTLVAGAAFTGLGLLVSGGPSEAPQAGQGPPLSKVEIPATQSSPVDKPAYTTVTQTGPAAEPEKSSFQAPPRVITLSNQKKIWAYEPSTKTWHTYNAPNGVTVNSETPRSGRFVALTVSGEPILEVAVFSSTTGKWMRQALREPAPGSGIRPFLGNNYAVYMIGRHAYAFSNTTGKWSEQALKEPGQDPYIRFDGPSFIVYYDSRTIHAFSSVKGTWQTMDLEKGAKVQPSLGPSDTALFVNGSRLYSFDPKKAQFEEVKTVED